MSWTKDDVQKFFDEYVFGFIFSDIQREINLARSGRDAGNLLAALGLLCYTEFMGGFINRTWTRGNSKANFNAFFKQMGHYYASFNGPKSTAYYEFRCGMVHIYLVKKDCVIYMLKKSTLHGVGELPDGRYYFVVEKYLEDFQAACMDTYREVLASPILPG
jgi:hypothetical protein